MAKLYNLARMSTATTGTGTLTLAAASASFLTFGQAGIVDGDVVSYAIQDGPNREVGRGTYGSAGQTLTRTVLNSTNNNSAINLSGGAEVFITALAQDFIASTAQAANTVLAGPTTGANAIPTFRALVIADLPALAINSYPVSGATAGQVLYSDGTKLQAYAISGTGSVAMTVSPTFTGTVAAAAIAIGGAAIASYSLAVTGPSLFAAANDGVAFTVNSANGWTVPALPNTTGAPWLALAATSGSGASAKGNNLLLATFGQSSECGITFLQAGGTPNSPTNSWAGGAGYIQTDGYVGGSVNAYQQLTVIEMGNSSANPNALVGIQGRIQLGAIQGSTGNRVGATVGYDSVRITNALPFYVYNVGLSQTDGAAPTDYERFAVTWSSNVCSVGPTVGGGDTLRAMALTGASLSFTATAPSANTSADGFALLNSTAASSGNQQYSPRLRLTGQGWKTTATAASQTVDWIIENQPVQGSANPSAALVMSYQINGGGYAALATFTNGLGLNLTSSGLHVASAIDINYFTSGVLARSSFPIGWSSATDPTAGTMDTNFSRVSAGVVQLGTTANNAAGSLNLTNLTASGSQINLTGLPTSDPHVVGRLWANSAVVTVSAG